MLFILAKLVSKHLRHHLLLSAYQSAINDRILFQFIFVYFITFVTCVTMCGTVVHQGVARFSFNTSSRHFSAPSFAIRTARLTASANADWYAEQSATCPHNRNLPYSHIINNQVAYFF